MGFTKLDEGILQSSIIGENSDYFKVWIALLASCKEDGIARLSPVFLSSVCRLDIKIVMDALDKFMSPDPFSRSKEEDGRRLKEVDGGYLLVNYLKYRERTYSGSKEAIRKRKQRQRQSAKLDTSVHPLFTLIIDRFAQNYEKQMGVKYYDIPKDVKELKSFLTHNPDMTEELFFTAANNCLLDDFHKKNLTIRYVCSHFTTLLAKGQNND